MSTLSTSCVVFVVLLAESSLSWGKQLLSLMSSLLTLLLLSPCVVDHLQVVREMPAQLTESTHWEERLDIVALLKTAALSKSLPLTCRHFLLLFREDHIRVPNPL